MGSAPTDRWNRRLGTGLTCLTRRTYELGCPSWPTPTATPPATADTHGWPPAWWKATAFIRYSPSTRPALALRRWSRIPAVCPTPFLMRLKCPATVVPDLRVRVASGSETDRRVTWSPHRLMTVAPRSKTTAWSPTAMTANSGLPAHPIRQYAPTVKERRHSGTVAKPHPTCHPSLRP